MEWGSSVQDMTDRMISAFEDFAEEIERTAREIAKAFRFENEYRLYDRRFWGRNRIDRNAKVRMLKAQRHEASAGLGRHSEKRLKGRRGGEKMSADGFFGLDELKAQASASIAKPDAVVKIDEEKLGEVPVSPYTGIPGWETQAEEQALTELAESVPAGGTIVELGAEYGRSCGAFLRGSDESVRMVSVDLFPEDHPIVGNLLRAWQENVKTVAGERQIGFMRGDSAEAAMHWPVELDIHLLFIDAAHDYKSVRADIAGWVEYVPVGGVMAFHDCAVDENSHPLHHEVSKAVDEWKEGATNWQELVQVDSLRTFIRMK